MDIDVDLAFGIFSKRVALHGGFELNAFQQGEGIDIAEDVANDREPVGKLVVDPKRRRSMRSVRTR